jgi:hypothetical protein
MSVTSSYSFTYAPYIIFLILSKSSLFIPFCLVSCISFLKSSYNFSGFVA